MTSNSMPGWVKGLLAVVGVLVLGPPALALLLLAAGLALKLSVLAFKVALVVGLIAVVVAGLKAVFGAPTPTRRLPTPEPTIDELASRLEAEESARRAALDLELARSLGQAR